MAESVAGAMTRRPAPAPRSWWQCPDTAFAVTAAAEAPKMHARTPPREQEQAWADEMAQLSATTREQMRGPQ
ncbi:MAG TPA: hypothetical protein VK467_04075 [Gemmatimonadales bacterium]|nr:hypothetical protein [Gemmatimonadales bacterium]